MLLYSPDCDNVEMIAMVKMDDLGIEPKTFRMRSGRSTPELIALGTQLDKSNLLNDINIVSNFLDPGNIALYVRSPKIVGSRSCLPPFRLFIVTT